VRYKLKIMHLKFVLFTRLIVHAWVTSFVYSFVMFVKYSGWVLGVYIGFCLKGKAHEFKPFLINRALELEREAKEAEEAQKKHLEELKENNDRMEWFVNQIEAMAEAPTEEEKDKLYKAMKVVTDGWQMENEKTKHRHVCPKCGAWHEQEIVVPREKGVHEVTLRCLNHLEQTYTARVRV